MKPSKRQQQKEAIDAARDAIMPIVNAMGEDNRREEEQLLFSYYREYYPLEQGKRIGDVTIQNGRLGPYIIIEIRDKDGMISTTKEPYKETITKAKKIAKENNEFVMQIVTKLGTYTEKIIESFETAKNNGEEEKINKLLELMQKLFEVNNSAKKMKGKAFGIENDKEEIIKKLIDFESSVKEGGYFEIIVQETYQIPTLNTLLHRIEEEKISIDDLQYLATAVEHFQEQDRKDIKKKRYTTFKNLSLKDKLNVAYNEYVIKMLNECKLSLVNKEGKMGESLNRLQTEMRQKQIRKINAIREKIENKEELTREEMLEYVFSIDGYTKEDIDKKVISETPSILECLAYLKEKFPLENIIDRKISAQKRYYSFAEKVKDNRTEAISDLHQLICNLLREQEENAQNYLETKNNFTSVNHIEEMQFLGVCISYLEETKEKSTSPEQEESMIGNVLSSKNKLDKLDKSLEIAEKLDAGITGINDQSVIDMQDFIENYIKGIEMLEDTQDITSTTSQVLDHIRRESQTIESWCPEAMQEIKENKAIVPKEKLLQKGLTV